MSFEPPEVPPPTRPSSAPKNDSPATTRPMSRAEQREHTRQALLVAAAEEFADRGYAAANLAEIADRVGVTRGLLHFYFRTKRDLAIEIVSQFDKAWIPLVDEFQQKSGSRLDALKWFTHEAAEQFQTNTILRAAVRLTFEPDIIESNIAVSFAVWIDFSAAQLRKGQASGEFRQDIDPESTASTLISAYAGLQILSPELDLKQDLHTRIDDLWLIMGAYICDPSFVRA